jgi:hypothetical protein
MALCPRRQNSSEHSYLISHHKIRHEVAYTKSHIRSLKFTELTFDLLTSLLKHVSEFKGFCREGFITGQYGSSRFPATASTEGDSSASRTQVLLSEPPMQNSLSTDNSTNWVPGWRLFHTNLLVFSSQPDFQRNLIATEVSLTHHITSLTWTADDCSWVWVLCYDRRSAGQSVLEQSTHLGLTTRSLLLVW